MAEADIRTVAAAASKDDERVIVPVLSAYAHVGVQGTVVLRDSDSGRTEIVTEEGYRIDKGWTDLGFAMMTDRLVLDKCFVALTPRHISHAATIVPLMQFAAEAECSLLLIAHQIGGSAQQTLLGNHRNNALHCCSVIAPSFHHLQRGYLDDMAAWTGGRVMDLDGDLPTDGLGYVDKAIITKERTVLICEENLVQNRVDSRINYLTGLLGKLDNEYDIDKVKQRIGRLRGRLAEIRAGAATDSERSELKHRIEDAIGAVRVAWQDGLLQGAGASLVQAAAKIDLRASYGAAALVRAMEEPCRKLHENAGKDGSVATAAFRSGASTTHVLDPTKVVCCALSAAVSTVTTLLLCEGSMVYRHDLRRRG